MASDTRQPITPAIKIAGAYVADAIDDALYSLEVRSSVRASGSALLRFRDPTYELLDGGTFEVGKDIAVLLREDDTTNTATTVFNGRIVSLGIEDEPGDDPLPRLLVEARTREVALTTSSTFKAYLNSKPEDVVRAIAGEHGLKVEVDATSAKASYHLQTSTDFEYLTQLARRLGYEWFVADTTLHFRQRPSFAGPTLDRSKGDLRHFQATYSGVNVPKSVTVLGWDVTQKKEVSGTSTLATSPDAKALGSDAPFVKAQHGKAKSTFGRDLKIGTLSARDDTEAAALADGLALQMISGGLHAEGVATGNAAIVAGGAVEVAGVGESLSGTYYVTEVVHRFGRGGEALTTFTCDGHHYGPSTLPSVTDGASGTAPATSGWGGTGLLVAIVTNVNDPEKLGRVKVKFPSLGSDVESDWARTVIPGVGDKRGFDARPEVNDEVIVGFEHGDPRQVVVLGGVWSSKSPPPRKDTSQKGLVTRREVVSRDGHAITLSDGEKGAAKGDESRFVEIALADDATSLHLGESRVDLTAKKGNQVRIETGDASVTLTGDGDVLIEGNNITLDAKQKLTLVSGTDTSVKAGANLKLEGSANLEAKAGAMGKFEASATMTVKGALVQIN